MPARDAADARSYGLPLPAMGSVQRTGQGQASPVQHAIQSPVAADRTVRSSPVMRSLYGSSHTMLATVGRAAVPLVRTAGAAAASIQRQPDTILPGRVQRSEATLAHVGSAAQGTAGSPSIAQRAPANVVGSGPPVPTSDRDMGAPLPLRHAVAATRAGSGSHRDTSNSLVKRSRRLKAATARQQPRRRCRCAGGTVRRRHITPASGYGRNCPEGVSKTSRLCGASGRLPNPAATSCVAATEHACGRPGDRGKPRHANPCGGSAHAGHGLRRADFCTCRPCAACA